MNERIAIPASGKENTKYGSWEQVQRVLHDSILGSSYGNFGINHHCDRHTQTNGMHDPLILESLLSQYPCPSIDFLQPFV